MLTNFHWFFCALRFSGLVLGHTTLNNSVFLLLSHIHTQIFNNQTNIFLFILVVVLGKLREREIDLLMRKKSTKNISREKECGSARARRNCSKSTKMEIFLIKFKCDLFNGNMQAVVFIHCRFSLPLYRTIYSLSGSTGDNNKTNKKEQTNSGGIQCSITERKKTSRTTATNHCCLQSK